MHGRLSLFNNSAVYQLKNSIEEKKQQEIITILTLNAVTVVH